MTNLSDIFLEHKTKVLEFIDGTSKAAYRMGYNDAIKKFKKELINNAKNNWCKSQVDMLEALIISTKDGEDNDKEKRM